MRLTNLNNDVGLGFNQRIFQVLGRVLDTGGFRRGGRRGSRRGDEEQKKWEVGGEGCRRLP